MFAPLQSLFAVLSIVPMGVGAMCVRNSLDPEKFLPPSVVPTHYNLNLYFEDPDSQSMDYGGEVVIDFDVVMATSCVILHTDASTMKWKQWRLEIDGVEMTAAESVASPLVTLSVAEDLPAGAKGKLTVVFGAKISSTGDKGIFKQASTYTPSATSSAAATAVRAWNSKQAGTDVLVKSSPGPSGPSLYATDFEQEFARQHFPCFDEPQMKAIFQTCMNVPLTGLTVLTSSKEVGDPTIVTVEQREWERTCFEETLIPISTYLVGFAVGRFEYLEKIQNGVRHRVYVPIGAKKYAQFALDFGAEVIAYVEELWGLPYSEMSPKFDQLAAGYFENAEEVFALCTYDSRMLLDDASFSETTRKITGQIIAHEIIHQWLGDAVTIPDWSNEYLKEGFTRFEQYAIVDDLRPDWGMFSTAPDADVFADLGLSNFTYYGYTYEQAFNHDVFGRLTAAITPKGLTASGTSYYEKGSVVNYMFYLKVGKQNWNNALKAHINRWKFKPSFSFDDLMSSFESVGLDLRSEWSPWILAAGMPKVTVAVGANTVTFKQTPSSTRVRVNPKTLWWIRFNLRVTPKEVGAQPFDVPVEFSTQTHSIDLPAQVTSPWVEANSYFEGFVLVDYEDSAQRDRLLAEANQRMISRYYHDYYLKKNFQLLADTPCNGCFRGDVCLWNGLSYSCRAIPNCANDCCSLATCSQESVKVCVGGFDPFCLTSWDDQCVQEAQEHCGLVCPQ